LFSSRIAVERLFLTTGPLYVRPPPSVEIEYGAPASRLRSRGSTDLGS
jgi:hypothetical protein